MSERADIRSEFPVTKNFLYLDSAHQSPLAASVKAAIERFLVEGLESSGPKVLWLERVERVRSRAAAFLGAEHGEITFTKNTSEGLNAAANALPLVAGDNVVMVRGDHPNLTYAFLNLERRGVEARFVEMAEVVDADTFAPAIDARTKVVALSHVTFHAGHRFDIASIGRLCKERGIHLVLDATQSVGVMPVDVKEIGVSLLACSAHKGLLTPHGLGLLYVDKSLTNLEPVYLGTLGLATPPSDLVATSDNTRRKAGARQFDLGNYNLLAIHALDAALELIEQVGLANIERHVLDLGDHLIACMDELGVGLIGPRARELRSHVYVLDLPVDTWLQYLRDRNVRLSPERGFVRISFGMFNTVDDVDRLADLIRLREGAVRSGRAA
jgi:selenocysteine lyase/cysteine desulfurase